jgi:AcrR family transcriptional regulator
MTVVERRRDQVRAATVAEIKETARRYLLEDGPHSISRRAIARDMGMSAPALARYFPSPDALLTALSTDAYDSLREQVERARDGVPDTDQPERFRAAARAFRRWALQHPAEFQLVFAKPLPAPEQRRRPRREPRSVSDYARTTHAACGDAGLTFGAVFTRIVAQAWARHPFPVTPLEQLDPSLRAQLTPLTEEINESLPADGGLPIPAVAVLLSCWTRLYGLVAVEAFGHQRWALADAEPLFEAELDGMVRGLRPA